jgi:hypothetical protein
VLVDDVVPVPLVVPCVTPDDVPPLPDVAFPA